MTISAADMEARIRAIETEIATLKGRVERLELEAEELRGDADIANGQTIPAREALDMLRRKYNIPTKDQMDSANHP